MDHHQAFTTIFFQANDLGKGPYFPNFAIAAAHFLVSKTLSMVLSQLLGYMNEPAAIGLSTKSLECIQSH